MFQKKSLTTVFSIINSIWLYYLVLHVTDKKEEVFCSPENMYETFNVFDYREHTCPILKPSKVLTLQDIE